MYINTKSLTKKTVITVFVIALTFFTFHTRYFLKCGFCVFKALHGPQIILLFEEFESEAGASRINSVLPFSFFCE